MRVPATKEASTDPLRVQATMDTIASGSSKARVATEAGFYDQEPLREAFQESHWHDSPSLPKAIPLTVKMYQL